MEKPKLFSTQIGFDEYEIDDEFLLYDTGNEGIDLLWDFVMCHQIGSKPSPDTMNRLFTIFDKYLKDGIRGKTASLDKSFGIAMKDFRQIHKRRIYSSLCCNVEALNHYFGISYDHAYSLLIDNIELESEAGFLFKYPVRRAGDDAVEKHPDNIGAPKLEKEHKKWSRQNRTKQLSSFERNPWNHAMKSSWLRKFKNISPDTISKYRLKEYLTD